MRARVGAAAPTALDVHARAEVWMGGFERRLRRALKYTIRAPAITAARSSVDRALRSPPDPPNFL